MSACIALIDDDPDFTGLVTEILEESGWGVAVCDDDRSAIACIRDADPDLIILDVRMRTRESGWEILDGMSEDPELRSKPVIVCTAALDDLEARQSWLDERGITSLAKPFDIEEMIALVEKLLPDGGDGRATPAPSNGGMRQS